MHHLVGVDLQLPELDLGVPERLFAGDFGHVELVALRKRGRTPRWVELGRFGAAPAAAGCTQARERELQSGWLEGSAHIANPATRGHPPLSADIARLVGGPVLSLPPVGV